MGFPCTKCGVTMTVLAGSDPDTIKLRCPKCGGVAVAKPLNRKVR